MDAPAVDLSFDRLETVLEDGEFVLCRSGHPTDTTSSSRSVLVVMPRSEHPRPQAVRMLEHEFALRDDLDPASALRPLALTTLEGRPALVLDDPGGEPLLQRAGTPMDVADVLRVGAGVAAALRQLHGRGLIHKDIKPANVMTEWGTDRVWLRGFGLTSRSPRERRPPEPPEFIAGTLAYMAPEQTGWMNRSVDARSDLYALGVVLYELSTGSLPFPASDAMGCVHGHIAKRPVPPAERRQDIPDVVSAIVMKLLAKTAEDRYQTAAGVEHDLRRGLAQWEAAGRIDAFPLAEQDIPDRLVIPEKLYGRGRETKTLLDAFERVVTSGTPELVLVSGYSGIGKSSVVNELHRMLVLPRGLFAAGKFDQYKRDIPYATLAQAFQSLVRGLLGKGDAELSGWRDALVEALGSNGRLMTDLVPELTLIIGDQPPVSQLAPQDARRRFQLVFRRLIGVFARPDHPLALFLDDLQWLDAATLDLFEDLLTPPGVPHLMLIGAYRDNEVATTHPLMRKLEAIRSAGAHVREIALATLAREDVAALIADALRCEPERADPLARLVHAKTAGNPFFTIQFISSLAEEGMLTFDHDAARWSWDLDRIHAVGYTDNVVELMVGKLTRLPAETRQVVQQLACLGNAAAAATLSLAYGKTETEIHSLLDEAVRADLLERRKDSYHFIHDRIQEAAYLLVPDSARAEAHLRIGRLLVANTPVEQREEAVYEIVNQLNRGTSLITSEPEREQLAALNLIAAKRAKASTAYGSALNYLVMGEALLPGDCWEGQYPLVFAMEVARAECEFMTGDLAAAEERLATLYLRAANLVDKAAVACLRAALYTTLARPDRAVEICVEYLRDAGVACASHPTDEEVSAEYERLWTLLEGRPIEALFDLPLMSDPGWRATMEVLTELSAPAYFLDTNLWCLVLLRMANLSTEHGNCDGSCYAYAYLNTVVGARFGNYRAGVRFGELSLDLIEKKGLDRFKARVYFGCGIVVIPWGRHIRAAVPLLRRGLETALETGDQQYAAYAHHTLVSARLTGADPLADVQREAESALELGQRARFGPAVDTVTGQLGFIRTVRGLTREFGSFGDDGFDEGRFEQHLEASPPLIACWYWIRQLQARLYAGDYAQAVAAAARARPRLQAISGLFEEADYHFYAALARAGASDSATPAERREYAGALAEHHQRLALWAENCPENFAHRAALVGAEIARLGGRELEAARLYEQAIRLAREQGFVQNEGLAYELAARCYAAGGFEAFADLYLRRARHCYQRWGADGKVRQLNELYPGLREHEPAFDSRGTSGATVEQLELATVLKVSQAVSGEIVLDKLVETLLLTAIEQAGAERGVLIVPRGNELWIHAEARTSGSAMSIVIRGVAISSADVPESVVRYAARAHERVSLDDASTDGAFVTDDYIRREHARSVLCLPLLQQGQLMALLYLENHLATAVFTPARMAVLNVVASQAAASLEKTRLYQELQEHLTERKRAEEALRGSEQRFRLAVESIPGLISILDANGEVEVVNGQVLTYFGKTLEELKHWGTNDCVHDDDRPRLIAEWMRSFEAGQPFDTEQRLRRADGVYRWFQTRGLPLRDGEGRIIRWYMLFTDIDDRKCAEQILQRSQLYLSEAQKLTHVGSWALQPLPGKLVHWSDELLRIFGFDPAAAPTLEDIVNRVHPDDREQAQQRSRQQSSESYAEEYRIMLPDGTVKHLHVIGHPILDATGTVVEFIGTAIDITERKRAEAELRQAQTALAHRQRVSLLGEVAASLAHEIKQPIAAARIDAKVCQRALADDRLDVQAAREAATRLVNDAKRADEIIKRTTALYKSDTIQRDRVDINAVIREMVVLFQQEAGASAISIQTMLIDSNPQVMADRVQMQQVFMNLMLNAIEAMRITGGALTISSQPGEGAELLISVSDTGVGLPTENPDQIFDSFVTTKPQGTGMGLAITRSIVESHGGRLWAFNNSGGGATFLFTLPADLAAGRQQNDQEQ